MESAYTGYSPSTSSPGTAGEVVTPSDSTDLPSVAKSLLVTVAGNLVFDTVGGSTITLNGLPQWFIVPWIVKRVHATGTTATVVTIRD